MTAVDQTMTPYMRETFALLDQQDPVAVMRETPVWIATRIQRLGAPALRQPEAENRWSITQVLAHLADTEIAWGWRARVLLTEDSPPLHGFDETAWMTRFDGRNAEAGDALATFTTLRRWNLRVWESATPADRSRIGIHSQRGPESFERALRLAAGHDLRHRRQIDRILGVVG